MNKILILALIAAKSATSTAPCQFFCDREPGSKVNTHVIETVRKYRPHEHSKPVNLEPWDVLGIPEDDYPDDPNVPLYQCTYRPDGTIVICIQIN